MKIVRINKSTIYPTSGYNAQEYEKWMKTDLYTSLIEIYVGYYENEVIKDKLRLLLLGIIGDEKSTNK